MQLERGEHRTHEQMDQRRAAEQDCKSRLCPHEKILAVNSKQVRRSRDHEVYRLMKESSTPRVIEAT